MVNLLVRSFITVFITVLLFACSSDESIVIVEDFDVTLSEDTINIEPGESQTINYTLELNGSFDVSINIENLPTLVTAEIDTLNSQITFSANEETSGNFNVVFRSQSLEINKQITYTVAMEELPPEETPDGDNPTIDNDQDFIIHLPTDYITIFEDESVIIDLERNYEINELIEESFYCTTDNISCILSIDKTQLLITADSADEDTYGELTAVTNVNGILYESKMYIIYYNKNAEHTDSEPPVIALLGHEIPVSSYSSTVKQFDIYDPDSDRISYRVISSPSYVETHVNKIQSGYEMVIYTVGDFDENNNDIVLEVSDGFSTDVHTFNLVEDDQNHSENHRPRIQIEENVSASLIYQFQGDETGLIAEMAFIVEDLDNDDYTLSAFSSSDKYEFQIIPPFLYVRADDISDLQYDQIILTADDGQYSSRFTYHFYIQDNFTEFLGGNPNLAPMTNLPTEITMLEGEQLETPFISYDYENHPFDVGIQRDSDFVDLMLTDAALVLTASNPEVTTTTSIAIWLQDIFESRREHNIDITINKNTPPVINSDVIEITENEQTEVEIELEIFDPDQDDIEPSLLFDEDYLTVNYEDGILTVNSLDLSEDYIGTIVVTATDDFNTSAEYTLDVNYQFLNPDNSFPVITIAQTEFELLPGEDAETTVAISDLEDDPLVISSFKDGDDLSYEFDQETGIVTFSVSNDADYLQEFTITISASDGFGLTQENITITVPNPPTAPVLTVFDFNSEQPEGETFEINFSAYDVNEEEITMTIESVSSNLTVAITSEQSDGNLTGYLTITPIDNVLSVTSTTFDLVATDEANYSDSQQITIDIQPVNDPPLLEYVYLTGDSNANVVLTNDSYTYLTYAIEDPDTNGQDVFILYDSGYNYDYDVEYDVQSTTSIRVNGTSKEDTYNLVSNNGTISNITSGDSVDQTLTIYLNEVADDGNLHGDQYELPYTVEFENSKPDFGSTADYIRLIPGGQDYLNLDLSDADGEDLCVAVINSSDDVDLYEERDGVNLINSSQVYCDTDIEGGLTRIRMDSASDADGTILFTIQATDGYEVVNHIVSLTW